MSFLRFARALSAAIACSVIVARANAENNAIAPSSPTAKANANSSAPATATVTAVPTAPTIVQSGYEIVHVYPHDTGAFTEGLLIANGHFFESTGMNGESKLREVDINTGRVLRQVALAREYFGEGLTILGDRAYQLTYQTNVGFVYRLDDFKVVDQFMYLGEGWGLTTDGQSLIMSDGTDRIRFLDPSTLKETHTLAVTFDGQPQKNINELEYIHHEIYANIWQTNTVVRIDPITGKIIGLIDFSGLLKPSDYGPKTDVLNGIAYDAEHDRLFVTGKYWPKVFEVRLTPPSS